ncbi:MAG TPA: glycosyltransferase family 2 protein [Candidatus Edwardsbacteria bacterium]|nr:glycosyltransferase family 2 protein [Candidatus Edwardsbacteria bacterium]
MASADAAAGRPKVVVVLPAYFAEKTLAQTVADIPRDCVDEIILVDDHSADRTVALAKDLGLRVHQHERNKGYGGNQKTCYTLALQSGADIIVMLHPDYQYDPKLIRYFVALIRDGYFDVMLGSRIRTRREALAGGMPLYKYVANRALSFIENMASGQNLGEWHSGMRAYRRKVLEAIDYQRNSDNFIFDSQFLFQTVELGFRIGEIPVPVRYFKEASSINLTRSLTYGAGTLWLAVKYFFKHLLR